MTLAHSHAGPAVAAASLVVALIVASFNPVAWALETDDSVDDEEQEVEADTSDEVDVEETESTDGETTTSDGEATTADAETVEESVDTATEPAPDPEATTEPDLDPEPAPEPDAELEPAPEPDGELEPAGELEPDGELEADEELEPDPEPDSELEPDAGDETVDDETVSESTSEVEETVEDTTEEESTETVSEPVTEASDPDDGAESDSDAEREPSADEAASEPSESSSSSTSSTSGSAPSSQSGGAGEGPSRSGSLEPQPADETADDDAGPAVQPGQGRWPKRTVEAAGEPVRPVATDGLSGEELAALKGTETTDAAPGADDSGVRVPMVAGPGQRAGESAAAPEAAERGLVDRVASVLGGAVPAYELPGVPSAAAMPVWLMLTAVALLLVVVAGHLRLTPDHYWATVGTAVRPRSVSGGTGR